MLAPQEIQLLQVHVYTLCGGGILGATAAENPSKFRIDPRIAKTTNSVITKIEHKLNQSFPEVKFTVTLRNVNGIPSAAITWASKADSWEILDNLVEFKVPIAFLQNNQYAIVQIPYSQAIELPDKQGTFIITTDVTWDSKAESQLETFTFESIPSRKVPVPRNLPKGYKMLAHPIWQAIETELTDNRKITSASFDEIEAIIRDMNIYGHKLDCSIEYEIDRNDYWNYKENIQTTWDNLDQVIIDVHKLIKQNVATTYPESDRVDNAPTIDRYLSDSIGTEAAQAFIALAQALKINVDSPK